MIKSYKIRIYPTKEQEASMWQHIGSCRFIWNYMLALQQRLYEEGKKHLSAFDMINLLKPLKNDGEHKWLYEVSNRALVTTCRDLDKAYKSFFEKRSGFPKFKSRKRSKPNYPTREDRMWFSEKQVTIEKIGKVKYKTDFTLPLGRGRKFSNPRISYVNGKWILSFGIECENQTPMLTDKSMGIDLGVKDLAIAEYDGERIVFTNINKSHKMRQLNRKQKRLQRSISRKYEANRRGNSYVKTRNIERCENELRKLYARITNIRMNYIHQCTHKLISLLPQRVVMENLNVQGMMKNKHLSKAVQEQCFYEFRRQMQYKCEWNGIELVLADRFYPSSKTCSCCGNVKHDLKLSDRVYKCDVCGVVIDRDYNAAINLSRYVA
jgi:putative transposase